MEKQQKGSSRTPKRQRTEHKFGGKGGQGACSYCDKFHPGKECYQHTGACLTCRQKDHFIKDCSNKRSDANMGKKPKG